ncbi:hypothetical protein BS17DRAFT_477698 [Gyrodon lividus]|nr:hypothetical protein BS17DRAFT_477698 [Gyrodon lividus]
MERGCFHFASYIYVGMRNPNISPDENAMSRKSRFLGELKGLLVGLYLCKLPHHCSSLDGRSTHIVLQ